MNRWPIFVALALGAACALAMEQPTAPGGVAEQAYERRAPPAASEDGIWLYFSPHGGCTQSIIERLNAAKETVLIQGYSFTSAPIAKAVLDAEQRGVSVRVVLDSRQQSDRYSSATFFHNQGIPVFIDREHAIAHNKIILIDGRTIITGSFNFTKAAEESNAENLLIIEGKPQLMQAYTENFEAHLAHSIPYAKPSEGGASQQLPPPTAVTAETTPKADRSAAARSDDEPASVNDPVVHVTKSGRKYHREGCKSLAKTDIPLRLSEARQKGYEPCAVCRPDQ